MGDYPVTGTMPLRERLLCHQVHPIRVRTDVWWWLLGFGVVQIIATWTLGLIMREGRNS